MSQSNLTIANIIDEPQRTDVLPSLFGDLIRKSSGQHIITLTEHNYFNTLTKIIDTPLNNGYLTFLALSNKAMEFYPKTVIAYIDSDEPVTLTNVNNYCEVKTTLKAASVAAWLQTLTMFIEDLYGINGEGKRYTGHDKDNIPAIFQRLNEVYQDILYAFRRNITLDGQPFLSKDEILAIEKYID